MAIGAAALLTRRGTIRLQHRDGAALLHPEMIDDVEILHELAIHDVAW